VAAGGARQFAVERDLEEVSIKEAGKSDANGLVFEPGAQAQRGDCHGRKLDELLEAVAAFFDEGMACVVDAVDAYRGESHSVGYERHSEIAVGRGGGELAAIEFDDLGTA